MMEKSFITLTPAGWPTLVKALCQGDLSKGQAKGTKGTKLCYFVEEQEFFFFTKFVKTIGLLCCVVHCQISPEFSVCQTMFYSVKKRQ